MKDIILIGAGGHAASCIDVIESEGRFRVAGLVGIESELHRRLCGYEVIATEDALDGLAKEYRCALIAVGQIKSSDSRIRLYGRALEAGFEMPVIVSPYARVSSHASVGPGSIIMYGAMVNANAKVGSNCIINSRALIEHNAEVGDHCHISTGAILNGNVRVGETSFIGSGTVTTHGISIGAACLVGMASVIRHDLPGGTSYWSRRSND
jgi:sugar O-acyltransferase (sialic acid O-acetyltransferase NeuD family)